MGRRDKTGNQKIFEQLFFIIFLALIIRIIPAFFIYGMIDVDYWKLIASTMSNGDYFGIYSTNVVKWPPLISWIFLFTYKVSETCGFPFSFLVKFPAILSDTIISVLIYFYPVIDKTQNNLKYSLFYALNPITIYISSIHGQFDTVVILFCFSSFLAFKTPLNENHKSIYISSTLLGIAIALKAFPIILLPLFLLNLRSAKQKIGFSLIALLIPTLILIPYFLTTPSDFLNNTMTYSSQFRNWGYPLLLNIAVKNSSIQIFQTLKILLMSYGKLLLLISFLTFYLFKARYLSLLESITIIFSLFYIFTPGFGIQYLSWIIPFAILSNSFPVVLYTIFASIFLTVHYTDLISHDLYSYIVGLVSEKSFWRIGIISSLSTYLIIIFWTFRTFFIEKRKLS